MKKVISIILLISWVALVLFLSFQNGKQTAGTSMTFTRNILHFLTRQEPTQEQMMLWDGRFRLWAHFGLLFLYGIFSMEALFQWTDRALISVLCSGISGIVLAVLAEAGKLHIAGRHCDLSEMGLNIFGAVTGTLLALVLHQFLHHIIMKKHI